MILQQLSNRNFEKRLTSGQFCLEIGPFLIRLRSSHIDGFADLLRLMYAESPLVDQPDQQLVDIHISLKRGNGLHRWWRPQVNFKADGQPPFSPFPMDHALALFEWGLNWCIATQAHQYLMLHAAVLERNGKALLLPALPGSGKSTLCAALMLRGWRLLSDEFGLYRPETGLLEPLPRPIPLKNESIQVIREFSPEAVLGPVFPNTRKGDVAHLRATDSSMQRFREPAKPAWLVFPRYHPKSRELLHPFAKGRAFLMVSGNSFNYRLQGERGFSAAADIVDRCDIRYLEFSNLNRAIDLLVEMTD